MKKILRVVAINLRWFESLEKVLEFKFENLCARRHLGMTEKSHFIQPLHHTTFYVPWISPSSAGAISSVRLIMGALHFMPNFALL